MATSFSNFQRANPPITPSRAPPQYPPVIAQHTGQSTNNPSNNQNVRSLPLPPAPRSHTLPPGVPHVTGVGAHPRSVSAAANDLAHIRLSSQSPPPAVRSRASERHTSTIATVASPPSNFSHNSGSTMIQHSISTASTSTAVSSPSTASYRSSRSPNTNTTSHYNARPSYNHSNSSGSSNNNYGLMAVIHETGELVDEDERFPPDYDIAVNRNTNPGTGSAHWSIPYDDPPGPLSVRRPVSRPRQNQERYLYSYAMVAGNMPLEFLTSVEPVNEPSVKGKTIFQVSIRANGIERPLGEPIERFLTIDPKALEFVIFLFPGNSSLPANCQYSLRVWLRANGVDHRIFGMDALWVGKDPDFNAVKDASFARLKSVESNKQIYHGFVGKAMINYTIRWKHQGAGLYGYSMDYEAGGVGGTLFEDMKLRFEGNPRQITFSIYTIPLESKPVGASHQLRVWLRSQVSLTNADPYAIPFNESFIYQRVYKNDSFKIGGKLDFASLSNKVVMGFSTGQPQVIRVAETQTERDDGSSATWSSAGSDIKSRRDTYT